jgi:heme A synthase
MRVAIDTTGVRKADGGYVRGAFWNGQWVEEFHRADGWITATVRVTTAALGWFTAVSNPLRSGRERPLDRRRVGVRVFAVTAGPP